MTTYRYKARDKAGKAIEGMMGADSERAVAVKLEEMGYLPIAITSAAKEKYTLKLFDGPKTVPFADLNMFTRQLYTLQKAGLPILTSLAALKAQTVNRVLKNVVDQTIKDIEAGANLSTALGRHSHVFNEIYISMVKSGEASGRIVEILERLMILGEHEELIRLRIQAALRYPMIVVASIVIVFLTLVTIVIPRFAKVYGQFHVALPLPTQILIAINYIITHFWWLLIIAGVMIVFAFRSFVDTKAGRWWWNGIQLKAPVLGPLLLKLVMSRFCRITGTLIHSGVPILQILDLVTEGIGNVVIAKTLSAIKTNVAAGRGMSEPMVQSGMFPAIVTQMVMVGEKTGKLDELLLHVSDYYDMEIDHTVQNLVSLIEPILIFILGTIVLFMALGIFLPMWNLMRLFTR